MTEFTNRELADCAHREVNQRERVYPGLTAATPLRGRRMSPEFAEKQIAMMKAIAAHFDELAAADDKKERLL